MSPSSSFSPISLSFMGVAWYWSAQSPPQKKKETHWRKCERYFFSAPTKTQKPFICGLTDGNLRAQTQESWRLLLVTYRRAAAAVERVHLLVARALSLSLPLGAGDSAIHKKGTVAESLKQEYSASINLLCLRNKKGGSCSGFSLTQLHLVLYINCSIPDLRLT